MSYAEAKQDGIPMTRDSRGFLQYHPPCHICGESINSWDYIRGAVYTCKDCKQLLVEYKLQENSGKEKKLETAIKRISKVTDIEKYDKAIAWMRKNIDHQGWFQSTEEIMVAMELIRRGVKAYHQVKIYEYSVDFVLPDYKVILEVDGSIYHGKDRLKQQDIRDEVVSDKMGDGWQVVRIPTDCINMNITKLMSAIKKVLNQRKCAH